ncbi:MAG TPA: hypothetical protein VF163_04350 [Micromonosporaceae bacterium]
MATEPRPLSRRTLLAFGAAAAAGVLVGSTRSAAASAGGVILPTGITPQSEISGVPTYYESTGAPYSFSYDDSFYGRMEIWYNFWYGNTPSTWVKPGEIWSYGAYVDKPGWHNVGRAFDLTRLFLTVNSTRTQVFNGRYDQWRSLSPSTQAVLRKRYWATAASLHYHFEDVLTYPYRNSDGTYTHTNHIHIDNGDSGSGNSTFSTVDYPQVLSVQHCLAYIWNYADVPLDGVWSQTTANRARDALARAGISGGLTDNPPYNWLEFNRASLRFGTGRQSY